MKRFFNFILISLSCYVSLGFGSSSPNLLAIAEVLKEVESNNRPNLIGDNGEAYGILQIHKECVIDVNNYYDLNYTHEDAKNPIIAQDIFIKYINIGIKLYVDKCGHLPNDIDIARMWNGGIYRGYEYKSTIPYMKKYIKTKRLIGGSSFN